MLTCFHHQWLRQACRNVDSPSLMSSDDKCSCLALWFVRLASLLMCIITKWNLFCNCEFNWVFCHYTTQVSVQQISKRTIFVSEKMYASQEWLLCHITARLFVMWLGKCHCCFAVCCLQNDACQPNWSSLERVSVVLRLTCFTLWDGTAVFLWDCESLWITLCGTYRPNGS